MKYLVVDGMVSGTGIRDAVEGGYLNPETLGLSENLLEKLKEWVTEYEDEHYNSCKNSERINRLDETGKRWSPKIGQDAKVDCLTR